MTWISTSETGNLHQHVPKDLLEDAEKEAKKDDEDEVMGDAQQLCCFPALELDLLENHMVEYDQIISKSCPNATYTYLCLPFPFYASNLNL